MREHRNGWTTANEITFIRHLGTGRWSVDSLAVKECSRVELLTLYLAGARKRDSWDGIDKDKVVQYAEECSRTELAN